ncbi:MAG: OmpA family protein, partial [Burkholderiales bacterium]|nr:OmpA family protein [Burkholderiales bacterium]
EKVTMAAETNFDFDRSTLRPKGKALLDDLVGSLKAVNVEVIIAVGYTDSIGSKAYNEALSLRRAASVKEYLVSKGIEANRIQTEGKGEANPIASNKTRAGRAENRRVEIEVVGSKQM